MATVVEAKQGDPPSPTYASRLLRIVPIAALIVSVTGVFLTYQSRRKEISCSLVASARLVAVSSSALPSDVHVDYKGAPVRSLDRLTFVLRNSGAAAIRKEDVRETLRLSFPTKTSLLGASVDRTDPAFFFQATLDGSSNVVDFSFDLLNGGDQATVSVYVVNSQVVEPQFLGRVVDVPRLVLDYSADQAALAPAPLTQNHSLRASIKWVLITVLGAISTFLGIFALAFPVQYVRYTSWSRRWKKLYDEEFRKHQEKSSVLREEQSAERKARLASGDYKVGIEGTVSQDIMLEMLRDERYDYLIRSRGSALHQRLKEAGVTPPPEAMAQTFWGMLAAWLVAGSFSTVFGISSYLVYLALRP